jgi:hypothetical protein
MPISKLGHAVQKRKRIPGNILLAALLRALVGNAKMFGRLVANRKHDVEDVRFMGPREAVENSSHHSY